MAKKNIITAEQATEALDILTQFVAANGAAPTESADTEETEEFELPTSDEIDELDKKGAIALAAKLEIDVAGLKEVAVKSLLKTLVAVVGKEEVDGDDVNTLAEACGIPVAKKQAATEAGIREYIENLGEAEDTEEAAEEEEEEAPAKKPAKGKKPAADDEEEEEAADEDEDEEEAPAKKPAKGKKAAAEDDEDTEDDESEEAPEKDADDAETEEADEEEIDDDTKEERVSAYNAVAEKEVTSYAKLEKVLKGNAWGEVYMVGEEAYCCGLPLEESDEIDGRAHGICAVTGQHWVLNKKETAFEKYTPAKKAGKTSKK